MQIFQKRFCKDLTGQLQQTDQNKRDEKSRPVFGPLIKVYDSSDDEETTVERRNNFTKGSGDYKKNKDENLNCKYEKTRKLPSTSSQNKSYESNEKTDEEEKYVPGWYGAQDYTRKFERDMEIPEYTGCYISQEDFDDHLSDYCKKTNQESEISNFPQNQYWKEESLNRPAKEIQAHHQNSSIKCEIDHDISNIASELMAGDSEVVNKITSKQLKSGISSSQVMCQKQPMRTKTVRIHESDITVNITETTYPQLFKRPITNTRTPCHTPELPVQRQNIFNQIPISTKALLQRSYNKINFLSSKQRADPEKPLFKSKSDCQVNYTNFWDNRRQIYITCSAYEYRPTAYVVDISRRLASPSVVTQNPQLKRTASSKTVQQVKRQKTVPTKKSHVKAGNQVTFNSMNLFAIPLYIPSQQNKNSSSSTKDWNGYRQC